MRKKPPPPSSGLRLCDKCAHWRPEKSYGPDRRRKDGTSTVCTPCKGRRRSVGSRDQRIRETYGLSPFEYAALLAAQGGGCAICKGVRTYHLDVDHDHALEKAGYLPRQTVRGLLCKQCNRRILRSCRDSVELLEAAISYLKNPPAQGVLR